MNDGGQRYWRVFRDSAFIRVRVTLVARIIMLRRGRIGINRRGLRGFRNDVRCTRSAERYGEETEYAKTVHESENRAY